MILITFASSSDISETQPLSTPWVDAPCTPEEEKEAKHLVEALFLAAEKDLQLQRHGTPTFDFTNNCQTWMWMFTFTVKNTPGYFGGVCEEPEICSGIVIPGIEGLGALTAMGSPPMHLYNTINNVLV